MKYPNILIRTALLLSVLINLPAQAAPSVLVSIKPLQLITSAITDGVTTPDLLLEPGTSPHDYSMRPSDIRLIKQADVIFWVGEDLEGFLTKTLHTHARKQQVIALMDAPGVAVERFSSHEEENADTDIEEHEEEHDHHHHGHGHDHDHGSHDPHIWLSPKNALAIAQTITATLTKADKEHAVQYQKNFETFKKRLAEADQKNKTLLANNKKGFFVFHDAWGYFARHYQLEVLNVLTLNPEQQPGARHLSELKQQFADAGSTCIFREPQFNPAYLDNLLSGTDIHVSTLDPLGSDIEPGSDAYIVFINSLSQSVSLCLGQ